MMHCTSTGTHVQVCMCKSCTALLAVLYLLRTYSIIYSMAKCYSYEPKGTMRPRVRNCKSTYSTTGRTMFDLSHFYLKTHASSVNISACNHRLII